MSLQVDARLPADVNSTDKGALLQVAGQIIQGHSSLLDRFIANNRQQNSLSGLGYRADNMRIGDDLRARYTYNNGVEKLLIDVYPTGGALELDTTSDTNLDGYVLWIHGEPVYPVQSPTGIVPVGPYAVFMNGYLLEESVQPSNYFQGGNCSAYAMLFGKTALLCASYTGDVEKMNDLINAGNFKLPFKMTPDSPGQYDAGDEIDGTNQPKVAKKFNYGLFDWMNGHNTCSFIQQGNPGDYNYGGYRWNDYTLWKGAEDWSSNSQGQAHIGNPYVWGGIYFPDVRDGKSPLKPKDQNFIGTVGTVDSFAPCFDCFVAEFYDRGKYMTVTQSWNVPQRPNQSIAANNTPLLFAEMDYQIGYSTGLGSNMGFNLKASQTKDKPDYAKAHINFGGVIVLSGDSPNPSLMGPHDYFKLSGSDNAGKGPGSALTDDQQAQVAAWKTANNEKFDDYNTKIGNLIQQWVSDYALDGQYTKQWIQSENVQGWWLEQTDANGELLAVKKNFFANDYVYAADDHSKNSGYIQQYLFAWNAPYDANNGIPLPQAAARYLYIWNYGPGLLFDANGNPDLDPTNYNGSFFGGSGQAWLTYQQCFDLADMYVKDHQQNMFLRKQDAFDKIIEDNPPPKADPFPGANGDLPFEYERFTGWNYSQ
jgi:hypothetical protein